jgi:hypothetical protein
MIKGHLPGFPTGGCSNSCSSRSWKFSRLSAPNDSNWKQVIQSNKYKQYTKKYLMIKQIVSKDSTRHYE